MSSTHLPSNQLNKISHDASGDTKGHSLSRFHYTNQYWELLARNSNLLSAISDPPGLAHGYYKYNQTQIKHQN